VPEIEAARVTVGQPVIVTTDALPGRSFPAKVSRHAGALDERTRTLAVEADVANADGALRPGMYVSARVGVELHRQALLVPATALIREKAAAFVFTLVDGKATRLAVKPGFNDGTHAEILEGLAENARVLVPGKLALTPGQAVTAIDAK
jgi:RND family efflux transporter MFP subunit